MNDLRAMQFNPWTVRLGLAGYIAAAGLAGCVSPDGNSGTSVPTPQTHRQPVPRGRVAAVVEHVTTQPADRSASTLGPPYTLDVPTIVRLVAEANPRVIASRESMVSAVHALEEFRANLSRLEPFTETRSSYSDFPYRKGTRTMAGEAVGGLRKETFEGAVFRVEGGGSASRAAIGNPGKDEDPIDQGAGGLLRGRIEMPFVGSRKRQDRLISQAFQESSARKARLTYLSHFRAYVTDTLDYYNQSVLYRNYAQIYASLVDDLQALLLDERLRDADDRSRIESVRAQHRFNQTRYESLNRVYLRYLLESAGLSQNEDVTLVTPPYEPSPYVERAETEDGINSLIEEARKNTPIFQVLSDAIDDAELQRRLAIQGQLDITAFVEGTHFPVGAESFDDRFDGWTLGGGVSVSVNDQRVLTASRRKAEANIREFQANRDAELLQITRQVIVETEALRSEREERRQLLDLIEQKRNECDARTRAYLESRNGSTATPRMNGDQATQPVPILIDQVLESREELMSAEYNLHALHYRRYGRIIRLEGALGVYYQMAGLQMDDAEDD